LILLALAGCGGLFGLSSQAEKIDERTWRISSPRIAGGVTGPNQRLADQLCPRGYRVLDQGRDVDNYEGGAVVIWTVRCL
jgi:hypothetical protein